MSESTHRALRPLQVELSHARSTEEISRLLRAVLDAHVMETTGVGTYTLESGETVYDPEDMLGVGVSLARRADSALNVVPIEWLEVAPSAARLHVLAWLLPTLWSTWSPPADHVGRLLDALEAVAPEDEETRNPLLGVLHDLQAEGELVARIRALGDVAQRTDPGRRLATSHESFSGVALNPNFQVFVAALAAEDPRKRADAAWSLEDLLYCDVHPEDLARVVPALLQGAARESDAEVLEQMLYNLCQAAGKSGSEELVDWDPLVPFLQTVADPECLGCVLTALGLVQHERYRAAIEPFLGHANASVREDAEGAIAELDHAKLRVVSPISSASPKGVRE